MGREIAVFGGGCFWCTEAGFKTLPGVLEVMPGYAGGHRPNPTYEQVCTGTTGHAEVVKVEFDPDVITYRKLLEAFFSMHDPTTLNAQGADVGSQYRSIILFKNSEQGKQAADFIRELEENEIYSKPIVTEVAPLKEFWPAEERHRDYYEKHRLAPYCVAVIAPKLSKMQSKLDF